MLPPPADLTDLGGRFAPRNAQRECVEKLDAVFSEDEKRTVATGELEDFGQDDLAFLRILMNEANGTKPHEHPVRERKKKPAFRKSPSIVRRVKRPGRRK